MSTRYHEYLASREWALKREAVRERSGNICERCYAAPQQAVNHLTYEHLYDEPLEDLQAICDPCHAFLSAKTDFDPCSPTVSVIIQAEHAASQAWRYVQPFDENCAYCYDPIPLSLEVPCKYCAAIFCEVCLYEHHEDGGECGMKRRAAESRMRRYCEVAPI